MMITFLTLVIGSLLLTLLCTALAWLPARIKTWQLTLFFGMVFILWIVGAILSLGWYPLTSLVVFLVSVLAGILLARVIPAKFWPFLIFLFIMSALDVTQILLSSHSAVPTTQRASISAGELYSNFFLQLPWGKYSIGPFDLLIITACGVYWSRRNGNFLVALAGMLIGVIVGFAFLYVHGGVIALIPFLSLGWLCSVAMTRSRKQVAVNNPETGSVA